MVSLKTFYYEFGDVFCSRRRLCGMSFGLMDGHIDNCLINAIVFLFFDKQINRVIDLASTFVTKFLNSRRNMPQDVPYPKYVTDAVFMIPDNLHPYGSECAVSKPVQSVMHHYGVLKASVDILEEEEFFLVRDLRMADPDGEPVCRALFKDAIADRIPNRLQRLKVHFAIRRALLPDPFAAVVVEPAADDAPAVDAPPPPPPKRRRVAGAATTPAPAAVPATPASSASTSAAASGSSSSSASVRDTLDHLVGPSDDDDDDDADDEDGGTADDVAEADAAGGVERDDVAKDDSKPSRRKDVVTLFNDLANEVNVISRWVACSYAR